MISRKHAALAADRNRIKRCIREAFRQAQHELGALDLLVRPPYGLKTSSETVGRNVVLQPATLEDMVGKSAVHKPSLEVIYDAV